MSQVKRDWEEHMDKEDALEQEIEKALAEPEQEKVTPLRHSDQTARLLRLINGNDTERMTKTLREQMSKIIPGLEQDLKEAVAIRAAIVRRIADIRAAIDAGKAALDALASTGRD